VENLVKAICAREGLTGRDIRALTGGQVNQVFLVDEKYVLRIGAREDALQRLTRETELLRRLENKIPVPKILAFNQQDEFTYQIQQYLPGQKLLSVWKDLRPEAQENLAAELAGYLKILHSIPPPSPGFASQDGQRYEAWGNLISVRFKNTLEEINRLNIQMVPGYIELAVNYFEENKQVLEESVPALIHGDLTMVNTLVDQGKISAILDFEYSMQAPIDYELLLIEAFCLYPNDWAEEINEAYCTADFASFIPLLRRHYSEPFEIPHLRTRVNLYQLVYALSSYLAWRKDNLSTIPPERMAAKEFYMAKITNFVFRSGVRMF